MAGLAPGADFVAFVDDTGTNQITHISDDTGELWKQFGATGRSTFLFVNDDGTYERTDYGQMDQARLESAVAGLLAR